MGIDAKYQLNRDYEFRVGQCVDHVGGGMVSLVLHRSRTALGREVYEIIEAWTGHRRHIFGHALVALSSGPQCASCPIKAAGLCSGL